MAELKAEVRHRRDEGVLQGVAQDHDPRRQALAACGGDVVLAEDLQHTGADQPGQDGRRGETQGWSMEAPTIATAMPDVPTHDPCITAATMPRTVPTSTATTIAAIVN